MCNLEMSVCVCVCADLKWANNTVRIKHSISTAAIAQIKSKTKEIPFIFNVLVRYVMAKNDLKSLRGLPTCWMCAQCTHKQTRNNAECVCVCGRARYKLQYFPMDVNRI